LTQCVRSPDINGDGQVNCADLAIMQSEWGDTGPGLSADINGDDKVNLSDLVLLANYWTGPAGGSASCPSTTTTTGG
jgi:hypothetical protein